MHGSYTRLIEGERVESCLVSTISMLLPFFIFGYNDDANSNEYDIPCERTTTGDVGQILQVPSRSVPYGGGGDGPRHDKDQELQFRFFGWTLLAAWLMAIMYITRDFWFPDSFPLVSAVSEGNDDGGIRRAGIPPHRDDENTREVAVSGTVRKTNHPQNYASLFHVDSAFIDIDEEEDEVTSAKK